jgi:Ca2+-binding RTX toxin-like protein
VDYSHIPNPAGVTVDLTLGGQQETGGSGRDALFNIENLRGSKFADTLMGNGADNVLEGGPGDDSLDGRGGSDTASYEHAIAGVTVSLASQGVAQITEGAGADTLSNFENLKGSNHDDVLTGSFGNNVLTGLGGQDTFVFKVDASAGDDIITDFSLAEDVIDLADYSFEDFNDFLATNPFSDTHIALPDGSTIMLTGIIPNHDLNSSHFQLA